ncbi:UNVERIFIED_CONTAM: hypothetical protein Sradi_3721000 [Sesamum radiatum]|uniref:Neprosin PEP catalytic domain-containing protein n=1 Tax=Sesamum radiatum TaxID=300843 RepID=A0AAW2PXW5_SESRA
MIPPQGIVPTLSNQTNESAAKKLWKLGIGCPERTIPIRRTRNKIDQKINLINSSRDHDVLSHSLQWNPNGIDVNSKLYGDYRTRLYSAWTDPKVGWWLAVGPSHEFIGYWPVALFNSIKDHADSLRFGGQVFTPSPKDNRPQMGSGIFINGEYDRTCYMQHLRVADETHSTLTDVDNSYIGGTDSRCYYEADQSFKNQNVGYSFLFGGAGGKDRSTCLYA